MASTAKVKTVVVVWHCQWHCREEEEEDVNQKGPYQRMSPYEEDNGIRPN